MIEKSQILHEEKDKLETEVQTLFGQYKAKELENNNLKAKTNQLEDDM